MQYDTADKDVAICVVAVCSLSNCVTMRTFCTCQCHNESFSYTKYNVCPTSSLCSPASVRQCVKESFLLVVFYKNIKIIVYFYFKNNRPNLNSVFLFCTLC